MGAQEPSRNRFVVPARQATQACGSIHRNRFLGSLKVFKNTISGQWRRQYPDRGGMNCNLNSGCRRWDLPLAAADWLRAAHLAHLHPHRRAAPLLHRRHRRQQQQEPAQQQQQPQQHCRLLLRGSTRKTTQHLKTGGTFQGALLQNGGFCNGRITELCLHNSRKVS